MYPLFLLFVKNELSSFLLALSVPLYKNAVAQPPGCFQLTLSLTAVFPPHLFLFIFFIFWGKRTEFVLEFWRGMERVSERQQFYQPLG